MNNFIKKAEILSMFFGVFGYGNFDLTKSEVAELLFLLEKEDEDEVKALYERLEKTRMG